MPTQCLECITNPPGKCHTRWVALGGLGWPWVALGGLGWPWVADFMVFSVIFAPLCTPLDRLKAERWHARLRMRVPRNVFGGCVHPRDQGIPWSRSIQAAKPPKIIKSARGSKSQAVAFLTAEWIGEGTGAFSTLSVVSVVVSCAIAPRPNHRRPTSGAPGLATAPKHDETPSSARRALGSTQLFKKQRRRPGGERVASLRSLGNRESAHT